MLIDPLGTGNAYSYILLCIEYFYLLLAFFSYINLYIYSILKCYGA